MDHGPGIAFQAVREHSVGARHHIQYRAGPMQTVFAFRVTDRSEETGFIPHLVKAFFIIEPDAAAFGAGAGREFAHAQLEFRFRFQDRIAGVFFRIMEFPDAGMGFDEEIIDQQFAAVSERDHVRRVFQIRHGDHLAFEEQLLRILRRPFFRQDNAVMENHFSAHFF